MLLLFSGREISNNNNWIQQAQIRKRRESASSSNSPRMNLGNLDIDIIFCL